MQGMIGDKGSIDSVWELIEKEENIERYRDQHSSYQSIIRGIVNGEGQTDSIWCFVKCLQMGIYSDTMLYRDQYGNQVRVEEEPPGFNEVRVYTCD